MIKALLTWLSAPTISSVGKQLNRAYQSKLDAKNDEQRLRADVRIAQLNAQQSVLLSEQGNWMTRWIRPAFALPFIVYNFKIIVWDKVLGFGTTEALSTSLLQLQMIVFGAYFLTRPLEKMRGRI